MQIDEKALRAAFAVNPVSDEAIMYADLYRSDFERARSAYAAARGET